jgi:hypothetical protein
MQLDWLPMKRNDLTWNFWNRYRRFLEEEKRFAPATIRHLDDLTDQTLALLEDPRRSGYWDRRGMVVGQVQSGKTSHYVGLVCKAADAGYRVIVVLAGVHNSLRSQTQLRLDEGFLGFDTQRRMSFDRTNVRMGVSLMKGAGFYHAHALTNSSDTGDFNLAVARNAGVMVGGAEPVLLVVKKYKTILENLINWATLIQQQRDPDSGDMLVRDVPMIVIDDEADHASVNTAREITGSFGIPAAEVDPTTINRLIRSLLHRFEKCAYVGYTATPFANIFIKPDQSHSKYADDLFPRSFIVSIRAPSNYIGPARVFGLPDDANAGTSALEGLPVIRHVTDYAAWMPDKHKSDWQPGPVPESLTRAIRSFLLTCAARAARGQGNAHNSMLIHVTRFVNPQNAVSDQVQEIVTSIRQRLEYGDGASSKQILEELRGLWVSDFAKTTDMIADPDSSAVTWQAVRAQLAKVVGKIQIKRINGSAQDTLEYFEAAEGLNVIAIGGDKLSRGLTLEGLSISYYLRASRMYDTLMQMGRWFGYRPGYVDLCRLFTTKELTRWYQGVALADEELRREFEYMRLLGKTPEEYGLRVRSHPDALMVTSRAKMRNSTVLQLSFSKTISETIVFYKRGKIPEKNFEVTATFLASLGRARGKDERTGRDGTRRLATHVWTDVGSGEVVKFLNRYETHPDSTKAQAKYLKEYIESRIRIGELTSWTVALISSQAPGAVEYDIGKLRVGLVERGEAGTDDDDDYCAIKRLVNPRDEMLDLTTGQLDQALMATRARHAAGESRSKRKEPPDTPDGLAIRGVRDKRAGLLLIYPLLPWKETQGPPPVGLAISFPASDSPLTIAYTVNNVYWDQEFGTNEP